MAQKPEEVTEEIKDEVTEDSQIENDSSQNENEEKPAKKEAEATHEYTEDEVLALESGWKPQDQWEGDPKKWVPAEEYNRRGELFGKIDSMGRDLRETKKALRLLQEHHSKVKETEYSRALASLKAAKKEALETGNVDAAIEADDQLLDIKAARLAEQQAAMAQPALDPRFKAWVDKNSWYQDPELKEFADSVGLAHARANPEKSPDEVLKYVELRVKKTYSDKFTNPIRSRPSAVQGREVHPGGKLPKDDFVLSDTERKVMMTFVNEGVMTKEQYIEDLKSLRGVS
jgi:hypothetical protein